MFITDPWTARECSTGVCASRSNTCPKKLSWLSRRRYYDNCEKLKSPGNFLIQKNDHANSYGFEIYLTSFTNMTRSRNLSHHYMQLFISSPHIISFQGPFWIKLFAYWLYLFSHHFNSSRNTSGVWTKHEWPCNHMQTSKSGITICSQQTILSVSDFWILSSYKVKSYELVLTL